MVSDHQRDQINKKKKNYQRMNEIKKFALESAIDDILRDRFIQDSDFLLLI
jgi:hypothetical protein